MSRKRDPREAVTYGEGNPPRVERLPVEHLEEGGIQVLDVAAPRLRHPECGTDWTPRRKRRGGELVAEWWRCPACGKGGETAERRPFGRIFQRPSRAGGTTGAYYVRYRFKGKEVQVRVGPDLQEARAKLAELEAARARLDVKRLRPVAKASLEEFWLQVDGVLRARASAGHFRNQEAMFRVAAAYFGERRVRNIDAEAVEDFFARLQAAPEDGGRGCSPATVNRYRALLGVLFREAVGRGFAFENPVAQVKQRPEELRPVPYLSPEDFARILAALPEAHRPAAVLAFETGLRRGELAALSWRDVDLRRGLLTVRRSKNRTPREIPLTPRAREVLEGIRDGRASVPLAGPDLVLVGLGQGSGADRLSTAFGEAAGRAGFAGLRFHDLRHGFASALAAAAVPIPHVGQLLGHKSIRTTMRYAAHSPADASWQAIRRLAESRGETPAAPASGGRRRRGTGGAG